jgi:hypothetical protein
MAIRISGGIAIHGRDSAARGSETLMAWRRRGRVIPVMCLAALAFAYVVAATLMVGVPPAAEQTFERTDVSGGRLTVYLEILGFDPIRDAFEARLDFATATGAMGSQFGALADRDILVQVADGEVDRLILMHHGEPMSSVTHAINITRGSIDAYPFDRYTAELAIAAYDGSNPVPAQAMKLRVIVWGRLPIWDIRIAHADRPLNPTGVDLDINVRRSDQTRFFAVTLYGAMTLMGLTGITIGTLLFLRIRRLDTTLAAVLSAMIFTLPSIRGIVPGAPPLGVRVDSAVFLWAELAVVIGLTLVIITWARFGDEKAP